MVAGQRRITSSSVMSTVIRMLNDPSRAPPADFAPAQQIRTIPDQGLFRRKFVAAQRSFRPTGQTPHEQERSRRRAAMITRRTALMGAAAGALLLATPALAAELKLPRE